ncbi:MAG: GTPase Era [Melioribacteraceae bacterium]
MKIKSGFVTIIGKPNVGKSTLMNVLLKENLSIITNKPQTTRKRILGILDEENFQIIFLDTPGILKPEYLLQEKLLHFISTSINDADILIIMISLNEFESQKKIFEEEIFTKIFSDKKKTKLLVINKIDLGNEAKLKNAIKYLEDLKYFHSIIPISATENYNIDSLLDFIFEFLPEHPKYYPEDQLTDEPEKFFVAEKIREKVFELYKDEIPYSVEIEIDQFLERENRKDFISASIIVERDSQKPIILGKKGSAIKKLGELSRKSIEEFLMREVFLELFVKVKPNWRKDENMLKNFGYSN